VYNQAANRRPEHRLVGYEGRGSDEAESDHHYDAAGDGRHLPAFSSIVAALYYIVLLLSSPHRTSPHLTPPHPPTAETRHCYYLLLSGTRGLEAPARSLVSPIFAKSLQDRSTINTYFPRFVRIIIRRYSLPRHARALPFILVTASN
jgi:hypothetical protein